MADQYTQGPYVITTDRERMDVKAIHAFLSVSYWARDIPLAVVERSIRHSLCFAVFQGDNLVGFARVVTDYATFAYLGDVFILDSHRGRGLGKWLMECVMAHPELQGLRRWILSTRDAHSLYSRHGFQPLAKPERVMEITDLTIYSKDEA